MTTNRRICLAVGGLLAAGFVALLLTASPIDPLPYDAPAAPPLTGVLAPNPILQASELLAEDLVQGPEDLAVDPLGRIYGGTADGRVVRLTRQAGGDYRLETFAETGGRPLGLDFDPAGRLIVADADRGLLAIDTEGRLTVLAEEAEGLRFGLADDLDVASDGRVYFSDASWKYGFGTHLEDLLEARPHGRLLRYDPSTSQTEVLADGLYFANGVALSSNEDFVLVCETYRYRITRYWLEGPRAGTSDIFLDNLPGFPDGVSSNPRGTFWVALFTVRNATLEALHPRPWLKRQLAKLPHSWWPKPAPYGLVLEVGEDGRIRRSLHDPTGERVPLITSAEEVGDVLYLGNLDRGWIGRLAL